jgi:hypothetical protein
MQFGLAGMATLSWPGLLKLRAANAALPKAERKSIIMVWLPGGQSHIDTYDPKPEASSEYRGPFKTISTKVPGTMFTELLPMNAKIADKFTIVRSMNQSAGGHPAGTMQMFSGDKDTRDKPKPVRPDWMSVVHYLRAKEARRGNPLPNYIGVPAASPEYSSPAYLGDAYAPFAVSDDPNRPTFQVPNIGLADESESRRLSDRLALRRSLDKQARGFHARRHLAQLQLNRLMLGDRLAKGLAHLGILDRFV